MVPLLLLLLLLLPAGEGIPDLLQLMVKLTQSMMQDRLTLLNETQCTVSTVVPLARCWVMVSQR